MKIKFGASLLSWITPLWSAEAGHYAIKKTAQTGFDLIEILLPDSMDFDAQTVKKQLRENNLDVTCSLNLPAAAHIPFYPKEALTLICKALDKTAALDAVFLGGVLHGVLGCLQEILLLIMKNKLLSMFGKRPHFMHKILG